ncbi:MAG: peptidase S8 [Deltaproteobacteria bacterium CG11_big_fil_rev_8_21_14_0_20_45_16]|nr:MAG: peptidase S8 [Deltaproteobacteria bacterium CG11_big_fil_rev_8_21_14_0_20_45_16]
MSRLYRLSTICFCVSLFLMGSAKASPKISESFWKRVSAEGKAASILVVLKEQADLSDASQLESKEEKGRYVYDELRELALKTQSGLIDLLDAESLDYTRLYILNAIAVYNPKADQIAAIAARDDVARIIPDPNIKMPALPPETDMLNPILALLSDSNAGDNIAFTEAEKVWNETGVRGEGIVVAGQDTGVEWDHPALIQQYRGSNTTLVNHNYHWFDAIRFQVSASKSRCPYNSTVPCDDGDHGTHTMGTIVGSDGDENLIGMAPEAKWIACRNMDDGVGRPQFYIECFQFFLAPHPVNGNPLTEGDPDLAPHVINNSWGCPENGANNEGCAGDEMRPVLAAMKAAGIMVVVSAGNDGSACSTINDQPASISDLSFSVGAYAHRTSEIAKFSSRGPSLLDGGIGPDVVAPGVSIRSAVPGHKYEQAWWSGTSMAGPHVAGLVALMWSANPALIGKVDETGDLIRHSSKGMYDSNLCGTDDWKAIPNNTYGYGIINAWNSVNAALNWTK